MPKKQIRKKHVEKSPATLRKAENVAIERAQLAVEVIEALTAGKLTEFEVENLSVLLMDLPPAKLTKAHAQHVGKTPYAPKGPLRKASRARSARKAV